MSPITPIKQGWKSELLVAADLTEKGYDVYLGFAGKYDMIVLLNDLRFTVEVKTSSTMKRDWHRIKYKPDLLALVSHANIIQYTSFSNLLINRAFEQK